MTITLVKLKSIRITPPPEHWRRQLVKLPFLLLFPLALWLKELGASNNAFIEKYYSTGIYPVISQAVNFLFGWIPFSMAEIALYTGSAGIVFYVLWQIVLLFAKKERLNRVFKVVVNLALIASLGYFLFIGMWGLNYYREPLASTLGYNVTPRVVSELKSLCVSLAKDANALRPQLKQDLHGYLELTEGKQENLKKVPLAYAELSKKFPLFKANYSPSKPVWMSKKMSYTNNQGIFIPFTMEPNINMDMPDAFFPSTVCHEAAHLYGFAREDEANFLSYMACMASGDPELQYSGTLLALVMSMNALSSNSPDDYTQIYKTYSKGVARDLWYQDVYWDQFKGPVAEASTNMNNTYLKSNKQADGVKSYGRMVDLLLAMKASEGN